MKLTDKQVQKIEELALAGEKFSSIAKQAGVNVETATKYAKAARERAEVEKIEKANTSKSGVPSVSTAISHVRELREKQIAQAESMIKDNAVTRAMDKTADKEIAAALAKHFKDDPSVEDGTVVNIYTRAKDAGEWAPLVYSDRVAASRGLTAGEARKKIGEAVMKDANGKLYKLVPLSKAPTATASGTRPAAKPDKPKPEWFIGADAKNFKGPFQNTLKAAESINAPKPKSLRPICSGHYTVKVNDVLYTIIRADAAKAANIKVR